MCVRERGRLKQQRFNNTKVKIQKDFEDHYTPDFFCHIISVPELIIRVVINDSDAILHSCLRLHTPLPRAKEISCCWGPSITCHHSNPNTVRCISAKMLPVYAAFRNVLFLSFSFQKRPMNQLPSSLGLIESIFPTTLKYKPSRALRFSQLRLYLSFLTFSTKRRI